MFRQFFPTLLIVFILLGAGCGKAPSVETEPLLETEGTETESMALEDGSYLLDIDKSSIAWAGEKRVGAKHRGTIDAQEGALVVQNGEIIGGTVVVDMTTIVDLDLENETFNKLLVDDLKSDNFFAVETYPTASFAISEVVLLEGVDNATHRVTGTMTIKGIENVVSFAATLQPSQEGIRGTATLTLDRTRWDVRFGSGKFFDNLGDELIEDEFTLPLDLFFSRAVN